MENFLAQCARAWVSGQFIVQGQAQLGVSSKYILCLSLSCIHKQRSLIQIHLKLSWIISVGPWTYIYIRLYSGCFQFWNIFWQFDSEILAWCWENEQILWCTWIRFYAYSFEGKHSGLWSKYMKSVYLNWVVDSTSSKALSAFVGSPSCHFKKIPIVFCKLIRSTCLNHSRTLFLHFLGKSLTFRLINQQQQNYSYILNRNSGFNMLYMKFD